VKETLYSKLLKDSLKQFVLGMLSAVLKQSFIKFSFVFKMKLFVSRQLKALLKQVVPASLSAVFNSVFFHP
jgi:hypothetical protein